MIDKKGLLRGVNKIHFTAVCGTAMGSVAVTLKKMGYSISGSDESVYPPMSEFLEKGGIKINNGFSRKNIKDDVDLFVIANSMSRGNPEVEEILARKKFYVSLPELIKEAFIRGKESIVITGTHGKSSITAMVAWLFECAGESPGFLIGGIPLNFKTGCRKADGRSFIVEGDEYDTAFFDKRSKFVHYLPDYLIINNIEFDHADIFDSIEDIKLSFKRLINLVPENGYIIANGDDKNVSEVIANVPAPLEVYGFDDAGDWRASNVRYEKDVTSFDVYYKTKYYDSFEIPVPGSYNIKNALSVIILAHLKGIDRDVLKKSFLSFKGLKRRCEVRGVIRGITVIDDFAHHPTAVRETLVGLRKKYPVARIFCVFEPRTNTTRRNILQNELAMSFTNSDYAIIAKINAPQKVKPEERLSIDKLIDSIKNTGIKGFYIPETEDIINFLKERCRENNVVVFMSNGDFDNIHDRFIKKLESLS